MPTITGRIEKMHITADSTAQYSLPVNAEKITLNPVLGQMLSLSFTGQINCLHCDRSIKKSFNQGYCYPCFKSLAQCDMCIMKPHTCHFHLGTCREPEWGQANCMQGHYVYLANSTHLKVGITKELNIPMRWLDQGALQALPIFYTKSRYHAGLIEEHLSQTMSDKTNWRKLFLADIPRLDLVKERNEAVARVKSELDQLGEKHQIPTEALTPLDEVVREFNYPVLEYPDKVKSYNFDKTPQIEGTLLGMKGQYLILDGGVLNMRKFGGYELTVSWE